MNKELCIKVGKRNNSILWCTVKKTSNPYPSQRTGTLVVTNETKTQWIQIYELLSQTTM